MPPEPPRDPRNSRSLAKTSGAFPITYAAETRGSLRVHTGVYEETDLGDEITKLDELVAQLLALAGAQAR